MWLHVVSQLSLSFSLSLSLTHTPTPTHPHTIQVMGSTILEQVFVVEYIVHHQMCDECHRREAKDFWRAVVQVRQKVQCSVIADYMYMHYIIMMSLFYLRQHIRRRSSTWSSWYWSTTPTIMPFASRSHTMVLTSSTLGSKKQEKWWTFFRLWSLAGEIYHVCARHWNLIRCRPRTFIYPKRTLLLEGHKFDHFGNGCWLLRFLHLAVSLVEVFNTECDPFFISSIFSQIQDVSGTHFPRHSQ